MSYEKQTWVTGEIITADKLNHIEGGVEEANSIFVVHINYDEATGTYSTEESWDDIKNACDAFVPMVANYFGVLMPYASSAGGDNNETVLVTFSDNYISPKYEGKISIHNTLLNITASGVEHIHEVYTINVD